GEVKHLLDPGVFAWAAGLRKTAAKKVLEAFIEAGLIDAEGSIVAWKKRQFSSDFSKNRTKTYRERKANPLGPNDTDPPGDGGVTPYNRTEQNIYPPTPQEGGEGAAPAEPKKADPHQADFAEWWGEYPRKVGKPDALKKYRAARKDGATVEQLAEGLHRWKRYWDSRRQELDKIPHPATWLHQQRYNDDPDGRGMTPEQERRRRLLALVS
ncbi:MAG TPA: hypothetical protein VNS22_18770, partial [Geminicoccus sp.]